MPKQQQIEEMATILWHEAKQKPNYIHGSYNTYLEYAEALYNAGCRKIRKTEVVISKVEEIRFLIDYRAEVRKAMAQEILQLLNGHTENDGWTINKEDLRFLAKKYGVAIEE